MSTPKHTPGPWVAALGEHLNTDIYRLNEQGNRVFVAEFATQADALLGAAAPAMYEALKNALAYFMRSNQSHAPEVRVIRAALAQAEAKS